MEFFENDDSREYSNEDEMEIDSMSENHTSDGGFTPISVFKRFFTDEIFNLITDQTNIYRKQKKRRNSQNKTDCWKDVETKDIESFLGILIVMAINDLPYMKLYWSKDNVFHNGFISSIISRDSFLQIFCNLHLGDNSLEPIKRC
jgi:hypothetical protein